MHYFVPKKSKSAKTVVALRKYSCLNQITPPSPTPTPLKSQMVDLLDPNPDLMHYLHPSTQYLSPSQSSVT